MPKDIYPRNRKKSILWSAQGRIYRLRRRQASVGEGAIDLYRRSPCWANAHREEITRVISGRAVMAAPEDQLDVAARMAARIMPVDPACVVVLPERHLEQVTKFILEAYATANAGTCTAAIGARGSIVGRRRKRRQKRAILLCWPTKSGPHFALSKADQSGKFCDAGNPKLWSQPLLQLVDRLTADVVIAERYSPPPEISLPTATIATEPKHSAAWMTLFRRKAAWKRRKAVLAKRGAVAA